MIILNYLKETPIADLLQNLDLTIMDIGARGGMDEDFLTAAWAANIVGFEPEPEEFKRLRNNIDSRWKSVTTLPVAIGKKNGRSQLFIPSGEVGASLLPHNPKMVDLFGYENLHRTEKTLDVDTLTLDEALSRFDLSQVDYLKIDVEGAEMDILRSALNTLSVCSGIKVEASFLMQRQNQPLIWEVMSFLHDNGFWLVDMIDIHRWRRRPVPAHPFITDYVMPYSKGVLSQCDLIYLRDFRKLDNAEQALRLSIVAAILGFFDYAVEVLRHIPEVSHDVKARYGIDLEKAYEVVSAKVGQRECKAAFYKTIRSIIPILRSRFGILPYNKNVLPY